MNWLPVYIGLGVAAALLLLGVATGRWLKTQREIRERLGERPVLPTDEVIARSLGRRDWLAAGVRVVNDEEGLGTVGKALTSGTGAYVVFDSGRSRLLPAEALDPITPLDEQHLTSLWARRAAAALPSQNHRKD